MFCKWRVTSCNWRHNSTYFGGLLEGTDMAALAIMATAQGMELPDMLPLVLVNRSFSMTIMVLKCALLLSCCAGMLK